MTRRIFLSIGLGFSAARAVERTPVESRSLASVGYDAKARVLVVEFRDGALYRYRDVPREVFDGLMRAASKGRFFLERIRGKYDYERVREVPR